MQKPLSKTQKVVLAGLILPPILWSALYYYLGVWPLDLGSTRQMVVGETVSAKGDRFRIMQVRTALPEGYETWLEHIDGEGNHTVRGIDGDDWKQWKCSLVLDEQAHKLFVRLRWHELIEYQWDKRELIRQPQ